MSYQVEMENLEELILKTHQYREFAKVFESSEIEHALSIPIVNQNKDILSMTRNFVISSLESEICKS